MRFPPQFLEEIRTRLPVSEVVGRRVKLKKAGREWRGLSPFNQEKTPSFFVNDQKQAWFDFSSGKNGSIFDFIMMTEGVSFPEAVERLATMAGLPMPKVSREDEVREQRRKSLYEVVDLASKFFEATLQSRAGAKARGYLADRGLGPETQLRFRMGYAPPDRFALKEHLGQQGVPVEDMIEAGLLVHGDDIPVPYDRFRDRVMFPIADWRGRLIAFGGRALEKDVPAKYLNSPETTLFHKGSILFNGASARLAAHDGKPLIVVEGYVDVIAMVTAGFDGAVAPLGTALTEEQLGLLWKIADEPMLCFDGDKAGRRAAYRAVDLALPKLQPGKSLAFAMLPEGQDPDDLIRSGGRAAMDEVLASARPLADVLWMRETESASFDTPERRAALEARIGEILGTIGHEAVRKYYRQDFEARVRALFMPALQAGGFERSRGFEPRGRRGGGGGRSDWRAGPQRRMREPLAPLSPRLGQSPLVRGFRSAVSPREALILIAVIEHPWLLETHTEEFAELELIHPDTDQVRRAILEATSGEVVLDPRKLQETLSQRGFDPLISRVRAAITHRSDWPARPGAGEADVAQWWAHIVTLHRKTRTLNRELKDAERALGDDPSEANLAWIRDVQNRLAALEGTEALIEGFGASSGRPVRGV
ncbi:DNA primase [Pseudorhodoplanes sp.]|uniref:DNA primase n=1 Tax=Pseudorhodoplanes sp. TaxID=1934341 RepID=UPI002CC378CC|nr:DNA primase [Pseudorhodoplanes sp.]HWV54656.1 DNA primase [Pseudorhodoplanes sp.]